MAEARQNDLEALADSKLPTCGLGNCLTALQPLFWPFVGFLVQPLRPVLTLYLRGAVAQLDRARVS
jgi:hypothetical protein